MMERIVRGISLLVFLACARAALAQANPPSQSSATRAGSTDAQEKNLQEYTTLLRANVRQQKSQVMAAVMQLDEDDAAKFWPIYKEYDAELTKLNDLRTANIQEYARNYNQMTDAKADLLVRQSFDYRNQRNALLVKYYGRFKTSLGAVQAARFLQVEDQLLMIIDLQIESALPIVGPGSS
jgi:hypothetical protein